MFITISLTLIHACTQWIECVGTMSSIGCAYICSSFILLYKFRSIVCGMPADLMTYFNTNIYLFLRACYNWNYIASNLCTQFEWIAIISNQWELIIMIRSHSLKMFDRQCSLSLPGNLLSFRLLNHVLIKLMLFVAVVWNSI